MKTAVSLLVAASLTLLGPHVVHARGFGGAHAGGGASAGGSHSSGYSSHSSAAAGPHGEAAGRTGSTEHSYEGPHGTTVEHGTAAAQGEAEGPHGSAAGGKAVSGTEVTGPKGDTHTHESSAERGVAAGPGGVEAGREVSSSSTVKGAGGSEATRGVSASQGVAAGPGGVAAGGAVAGGTAVRGPEGGTYAHGATGGYASYSGAHVALPTDAGYGIAGAGAAAFGGYHQTEAVSGSAYAARGAAVRSSYAGYNGFGQGWYAAHPGAWNPTGWAAGRAWGIATWPAIGSWYGWTAGVPPVYYDYGNNVTYQDNQVYYGDQPVASADQYYQQTATLAQSQPAPDPKAGDWLPLGVFGLVQGSETNPHYVMQLAVNKAGAVAGNYWDVAGGTSLPIQGAVDKKTQRVAWTVGDNKDTVGETGIYNLTKDEAPALIHLGKDKTQQWTLVRLRQPSAPQ
jgi:hypothetical protein